MLPTLDGPEFVLDPDRLSVGRDGKERPQKSVTIILCAHTLGWSRSGSLTSSRSFQEQNSNARTLACTTLQMLQSCRGHPPLVRKLQSTHGTLPALQTPCSLLRPTTVVVGALNPRTHIHCVPVRNLRGRESPIRVCGNSARLVRTAPISKS